MLNTIKTIIVPIIYINFNPLKIFFKPNLIFMI